MTRRWHLAALVLAVPLLALACGDGDDDGEKVTAVVEVDTSRVPEEDVDDALAAIIDVMEQRAQDIGGSNFDATLVDRTTISFEFANVDPETARGLFSVGLLQFREPTLDDDRDVICQMYDGIEMHVDPSSVTEGVDASGQKEAHCIGSAGEMGTVVWTPALGTDTTGETRLLTGRYLKPNKTKVVTGAAGCRPTCVQIEFTGEGSFLFEQITTRLINYPLGIFLDDQLIWAPQVLTVIINGLTNITGLPLNEANSLAAQLNSGPLPAPATIVSITPS